MRTVIAYSLICLSTLANGSLVSAGGPTAESRGFDATVAPILARRCLDCHSGPGRKGKLDLSTRASPLAGGQTGLAIVPGKLDESPLWERINADEMPPKSPLTAAEKADRKSVV